ncbi:methylated-DNA--[protein]-cysteine S-methyltransferase [Bauldia litoralis]|uniref:Methylated-DNA-[protein]-cysteine S-methyltransferase n=1 Tax=Bauldia litoralis TaxID=665467 RepID=A0A1G6B705_9HYPH|nr:methylated-DNA--[protein]-cysteine S-methyltransferase [Bauldia litoralis]SDB16193.1 methylated-DNA-[protein]-cysteine S-methyltransferase [Bauldia litoralis]
MDSAASQTAFRAPARALRHTLFETAFGVCGIAWSEAGIVALQLPEVDRAATEARLGRFASLRAEGKPPPATAAAIADLQRYFDGAEVDFAGIDLDLGGASDAHRRFLDAARRVRWGETVTYGGLARSAGTPGAARVVGQAMARNPVPIVIPCHRVLASGDRLGGFSAYGGTVQKERLLVLERIRLAL